MHSPAPTAVVHASRLEGRACGTLFVLVAVAVLATVFVLIERRAPAPLVRPHLLRSGPVVRANVGAMSLLGGRVGCLFILTLYMQRVRGWSAPETGLAVCPSGIVVALLAPRIAAPLVERFGTTRMILAGLTAAAVGYAALLPLGASSSYGLGMLPTFLLVGPAFTLAYGPLNMAATNGIADGEQGVAGGLVNTSFQLGPALVLAVVTAITGSSASRLGDLHAALFVPPAVAIAGIAVTALDRRILKPNPTS